MIDSDARDLLQVIASILLNAEDHNGQPLLKKYDDVDRLVEACRNMNVFFDKDRY